MKISDISKAFNLNSKEVLAVFKDIDPEKKASGAAVTDEEFEMFFSLITKAHQIKDMEAYTSGRVTITSVSEKAEKRPAVKAEERPAAHVEEKKPEEKEDDKSPFKMNLTRAGSLRVT